MNIDMTLTDENFRAIGDYVRTNLADWILSLDPSQNSSNFILKEILIKILDNAGKLTEKSHDHEHRSALLEERFARLDERMVIISEHTVHVEEELKHQRELMIQGFQRMDERFEQVEKRFEQVEKRFEQSDKRFDALTGRIDRFMLWSFGMMVTATGIILAAMKTGF